MAKPINDLKFKDGSTYGERNMAKTPEEMCGKVITPRRVCGLTLNHNGGCEPTPPAPIAAQKTGGEVTVTCTSNLGLIEKSIAAQTEPEASKFSIGQTVYWQGQIGMCSGKVIEITRPENSGYVLKVELEIGVEMFMTEESVSAQPGATAEPGCKECGEHEIHINHFAFLPGTNLANSKPFHAYEPAKPPKPIAAQTEKVNPFTHSLGLQNQYLKPRHSEQVDAARLQTPYPLEMWAVAQSGFIRVWGLSKSVAEAQVKHNWSDESKEWETVKYVLAASQQETQPPYQNFKIECEPCWNDFGTYACLNPKHPCYAGAGTKQASSSPLETPAPLILRCYRCKATLMAKQIAPNEYEIFNLCETCKTTPAPADTGAAGCKETHYYCIAERCKWVGHFKPNERRCPQCGSAVWKEGSSTLTHKPQPDCKVTKTHPIAELKFKDGSTYGERTERREGHSALRVKEGKLETFDPHPAQQVDAARWLKSCYVSGNGLYWTTKNGQEHTLSQVLDAYAASLKQETQPGQIDIRTCTEAEYKNRYGVMAPDLGDLRAASSSPLETPAAGILQSVTKAQCLNLDSPDALTNAVKNALATPAPADTGAAEKK